MITDILDAHILSAEATNMEDLCSKIPSLCKQFWPSLPLKKDSLYLNKLLLVDIFKKSFLHKKH